MTKEKLIEKLKKLQSSKKFIDFLIINKNEITITDLSFIGSEFSGVRVPQSAIISHVDMLEDNELLMEKKAIVDTLLYKYQIQLQYAINEVIFQIEN